MSEEVNNEGRRVGWEVDGHGRDKKGWRSE